MQRVLFFHQGKFSHTNRHVLAGLQERFASTEFRTVDLHQVLRTHRSLLLANALQTANTYGRDLLNRRRSFDDAFFGTRHLFEAVRQIALAAHRHWPADCSFQVQSMYDCSSPDRPHLVYTDHTYRSCREYPDYGRTAWNPDRPDWLIDLEATIYRHATCTLTMSRNVTRTLVEGYGLAEPKACCVGAGCNTSQQRLLAIPCQMRRYQARTVLFVGLDWQRKGGPQLVEAFRIVRRQVPGARLIIVGSKPNLHQEGVEVHGPVDPTRLPDYYSNASLFCMPSRLEPFGIVWLEAMAAGLPVIGLNLGATADFILPEQTGTRVEPDDIEGLARALIDLLCNPKKSRTFGQASRTLVCRDFTWEHTCHAIADHIRRAAEDA